LLPEFERGTEGLVVTLLGCCFCRGEIVRIDTSSVSSITLTFAGLDGVLAGSDGGRVVVIVGLLVVDCCCDNGTRVTSLPRATTELAGEFEVAVEGKVTDACRCDKLVPQF
jgi:hypothetical protein